MSYDRYAPSRITGLTGSGYGSGSSRGFYGSSYSLGNDAPNGAGSTFSDTSSRGYGSTGGYGGGSSSVGSSYHGYDYPSRSTFSSYGGSLGSSYDAYRPPAAPDRNLGYLSTSGSVSSLKDKFNLPSSSASGLRGPSGDRYSGRLGSSDYATGSGGKHLVSGYSSDAGEGGKSYGSSYSGLSSGYSPRTTRTPEFIPRSTSRDFGASYGGSRSRSTLGDGPGVGSEEVSGSTRAKSSYYSLTPFETRRPTTKASTANLTPFTSSRVPFDRQASAPGDTRSPSSRAADEESSDSAEEPSPSGGGRGGGDRNVRYLTSRATSPMDPDRAAAFPDRKSSSEKNRNRNRLIARTKTKAYPVGEDRKRLRQLKNVQVQADADDLDRYAGAKTKPKATKDSARYGVSRYGPSVAAMTSSLDDKSGAAGGRVPGAGVAKGERKEAVSLPKQSVFVPRDRKTTKQDDDDDGYVPINIRKPDVGKGKERKEDADEKEPIQKQSSFLERKWQRQEEVEKQKGKQQKSAKSGPENLSLKESIEKVQSWKKQLKPTAPESPDEDERSDVYGKDEWRKKKNLKNKSAEESKKDANALLPPRPARSPGERSEAGLLREDSGTTFGVADKNKQNLQKDKDASNRRLSPRKNSGQDRTPSPKVSGGQKTLSPCIIQKSEGTRILGRAFPSTESVGGWAGDVSSEDEEVRGVSKGRRSNQKPGGLSRSYLSVSTTSLPDLVTSSEGTRRGGAYIGRLRDIDNILGFSETEDDRRGLSDTSTPTSSSREEDSSDESSPAKHQQDTRKAAPAARCGTRIVLRSMSDGNKSAPNGTHHSRSLANETALVGEAEDIDDILDPEMKPKFLGPVTPDKAKSTKLPLRLDIAQSQKHQQYQQGGGHSPDTRTNPFDSIDGVPNGTLKTSFEPGDQSPQEMKPPTAKRFYPAGYSDSATREAVARHDANGQVTIGELVEICAKTTNRQTQRSEDEDDRRFAGYTDISEVLEDMDVDVKKLHDCAVALCKHVGSGRLKAAYLQPQTSQEDASSEDEASENNVLSDSLIEKIQTTVGVHAFIDKLIHSSGQELRRALFSLKQIFKNNKDVVREFIYSDGLTCLVKIGRDANHSYQGYILRSLGQLMLYIDGMNGIVADNIAIQWLYMLTVSNCYPVAKTSLRLLQMFLDYSDCNAFLLLQAVSVVSHGKGLKMWSYIMDLLKQGESAGHGDLSLQCMTLLNKVLGAIPDQDTFYDMTDALEEQNLEKIVQSRTKHKGSRPELLEQFRNYDAMVKEEDAQEDVKLDLIENVRFKRTRRVRSKTAGRKSLRHSRLTASKDKTRNRKKEADSNQMSSQFREPMKFKWRREYNDEEEEPIWSVFEQQKQQKQQQQTTAGSGKGFDSNSPTSPTDSGGRKCHVFKMSNQSPGGGKGRESSKPQGNRGPAGSPGDGRKGTQPEGEFSGLISRAKEGLSSSGGRQSFQRGVEPEEEEVEKPPEKSESELQWETVEKNFSRALKIQHLDFTDLTECDEIIYLNAQPGPGCAAPVIQPLGTPQPQARRLPGLPPIPPSTPTMGKPPLPTQAGKSPVPPPPPMLAPPPPPMLAPPSPQAPAPGGDKGRKTLRLHWKEGRFEFFTPSGRTSDTVWSKIVREVGPVKIDKDVYLELFESKASDLKLKQKDGSKKEITVLDAKRSNAINIGLTSLPPPGAIKTSILKMDNTVMNREGVEKILQTMMPTDEEKTKIMEAQMNQPDVPLGSAEQFLLTLSTITELQARLSLWTFTIDYEIIETEISEPLSDLRLAMEELRQSRTFKYSLGMLLSIGNCLNSSQAKGFTLEILTRVPEVKDTVQKHSLLHHLVQMIMEQFSDSNDLFSDLGAVNRCAKVDWDELAEKLGKMESGCKASWDHLRAIVKHDSNTALKAKLSDTLADFAERIIVLKIVYRRIMNRFHRFLLYMGYQAADVSEVKVNVFCKTIVEFALEYRTMREKLIQTRQKKDSLQNKERRLSRSKISASEENLSNIHKKSMDSDDVCNRRLGLLQQSTETRTNSPDMFKLTRHPSLCKLSSGHGSETESVYETGDEDILESAMRTATGSLDRRTRDKRKKKGSESKSWRSYGNTRDRNMY